jgi:uncharacterized membrane protein
MTTTPIASDQGKAAALAVYVLYLLSIPSAGALALAGVMVALICQHGAAGLWHAHLREQIRIWAIAFLWGIVIFAVSLLGWALTVVLIGFPVVWIAGIAGFAVMLWFTVKSVLGLVALMENRAP